MRKQPRQEQGEALAAQVRAELQRIGLESVAVQYIAERQVVHIRWPGPEGAARAEGIEFSASRAEAKRTLDTLRAEVRSQREASRSGVA